jgi:hypothetical protein
VPIAPGQVDHELVIRACADLLDAARRRSHLGVEQTRLLEDGDVHRGSGRRQAQVLGDLVHRHDPVTQVPQDRDPGLIAERLEHVERGAFDVIGIDM